MWNLIFPALVFLLMSLIPKASTTHCSSLEPFLLPPGPYLDIKENDSFQILCIHPGADHIEWLFSNYGQLLPNKSNNIYIDKYPGKVKLFIQNASLVHSGNYSCITSENNLSNIMNITVTVFRPVIFEPTVQEIYTLPNSAISLECKPRSIPGADVFWTFNETIVNTDINHKVRNSTLIIKNITTFGTYTCQTLQQMPTSNFIQSMNFTINPISSIIAPINGVSNTYLIRASNNTIVALICKLPTEPFTTAKWFKDGSLIEHNENLKFYQVRDDESVLEVGPLHENLYGDYQCLVENSFNEEQIETYKLQPLNNTTTL